MTAPLLHLDQATIRFGGLTAVNAVDFTVGENELVGLIGPNGAGKTTVFNLITGVYAPTEGRVTFAGRDLAHLAVSETFAGHLAPLRRAEWVVYAKPPFGGPAAVLAYLARYTHRVAIANSRLVSLDDHAVRFRWKDYRARSAGKTWRKY